MSNICQNDRIQVAHSSSPALEPTQPSSNGYRFFSGGKAAGGLRWPLLHLAARLKKEYSYISTFSPSGPSWPVLGWTLPLPLPLPFIRQNTYFALVLMRYIEVTQTCLLMMSCIAVVTLVVFPYITKQPHVPLPALHWQPFSTQQ
jgi:hypothetical protein